MLMRALVERLRQGEDPGLMALIDGKPLAVGGASHDPEARCGRGAGMCGTDLGFGSAFDRLVSSARGPCSRRADETVCLSVLFSRGR